MSNKHHSKAQQKAPAATRDQIAAFRKAAREAGADATDEGFKNVLRAVAKAKPAPQPAKKKRA